jgi:erythrocyte band 7 integral membrane protein
MAVELNRIAAHTSSSHPPTYPPTTNMSTVPSDRDRKDRLPSPSIGGSSGNSHVVDHDAPDGTLPVNPFS